MEEQITYRKIKAIYVGQKDGSVKIARFRNTGEWIRVKDRLPKEEDSCYGRVLAIEKIYHEPKLTQWDIVVCHKEDYECWMGIPEIIYD